MLTNDNQRMPVKIKPYAHQDKAYAYVCDLLGVYTDEIQSRGVALLMEMGTGKTLVAIGVAGRLYLQGLIKRVLIVAPLSIRGVWQDEFAKHADYPYTMTILAGTPERKRKQLHKLSDNGLQVVIVNYESAWRMEEDLLEYDADLIIADEGHKLKDGTAKQSQGMHKLGDKTRYKLLLTGTVVTNREMDVYSQYRFLNYKIFGKKFYRFREQYFYMGGYGGYTPIFRKWRMQEFLEKVHSIAYRITKAECLDLPAITEEVCTVHLEPKAMALYTDIEQESFAELANSAVTPKIVLTKLLRLSQITGGHLSDDDGNLHTVSTAKLDALADIIDTAMAEDKKLVIMARFVPELDDIRRLLDRKKIGYVVVRGDTNDRDNAVRRFQNNSNCRVFLGQIATAGLGITLTAASTMVFFSLDYSMSNYDQSKARIHRPGQLEDCHYIYLVCNGTIDRKVLQALQDKQDLAKMLVDDYRKGREAC